MAANSNFASHCLPGGGHYQFRCKDCGPAGNNTFATVDVHFGDLAAEKKGEPETLEKI
jgi:hypothetical protein